LEDNKLKREFRLRQLSNDHDMTADKFHSINVGH